MMKLRIKIIRLYFKSKTLIHIAKEIVLANFIARNSPVTVAFSDSRKQWQNDIAMPFRLTPHRINFKALTASDLKTSDLIVPLTSEDLVSAIAIREQLSANPIPIPSLDSFTLCNDKYRFNQALINNGFSHHIPTMGKQSNYPYILKKRIGEWSEDVALIFNQNQEQQNLEKIESKDYFCQEMIEGKTEYATHVVIKNKKIICVLNVKYVFNSDLPIKSKDVFLYKTICQCPYIDLFESILNVIDFEGICCINYKVRDDKPFILEINPRFGASLSRHFLFFLRKIETSCQ